MTERFVVHRYSSLQRGPTGLARCAGTEAIVSGGAATDAHGAVDADVTPAVGTIVATTEALGWSSRRYPRGTRLCCASLTMRPRPEGRYESAGRSFRRVWYVRLARAAWRVALAVASM